MSFKEMKGVEAAVAITEPPLKVAIVGEPGVGKSWFAATFPTPVLDLDFDGRKSSLAGKKDVYVKSYVDINTNSPMAISELEKDLNTWEYDKKQGKEIPATFVLDSMTYCRKFTEAELIRQQSTLGRILKVGTSQLKIGTGWDIINGNRAYLEYIINRLGDLGNVVAVFHSQDEKDNVKSTKDTKAYTGRVTIQPQYLNTLLSLFNDVYIIDVDYSGKRYVQTGITNEFIGKCSLKGLNEKTEEPDFAKMLAKHRAFLAKL
jgi:hypothetical protein